jgi:glycosidase
MYKLKIHLSVLLLALSALFLSACEKDPSGNGGGSDVQTGVTRIPSDIRDVVIYEANPKVFAGADGTKKGLQAITARLDDIKELGVNVLWIMPVYEEGKLTAADDAVHFYKGSPYCVRDYKKIDPKYGTLADLKTLVKEAHKRDIAVLMDWVANHTAFDNVWASEHPEWYTHENGVIVPPDPAWKDVADLNFGTVDAPNTALQDAMIDAMKYWIAEADIDGYRCDAVDYMIPASLFWDRAIVELRGSTEKQLLMFAEGNKADWFAAGFDMDFGWDMYSYTSNLFSSRVISSYFTSILNNVRNTQAGKASVHFTTNHDKSAQEQSDIQLFKGERGAMSAFVLTATLAGTPMIYSTQEIAKTGNVNFFDDNSYNYSQIDWNSNPAILDEYKQLMKVYNSYETMRKGNLETFVVPGMNQHIAYYTLSNETEEILVAVNVRNADNTLTFDPQFVGGNYTNLMTGEDITLEATKEMAAYEYLILKKQ